MARNIGGGRYDGPAKGAQDVARDGVGGDADRDRVEAGGGEFGDRALRRLGQHQRQRTRPERLRKPCGGRIEARNLPRGRDVGDVGDQGVEGGPSLGLIEAGDGRSLGGVGAEPINRLGRERDQAALPEAARSLDYR